MGTWSYESFGNDTACDWSYRLLKTTDLSVVEAALDAVLSDTSGYLDSEIATEAIAAIEVLAKLRGRGTQTDVFTEEVDVWVSANPIEPGVALLEKAVVALDRILAEDSELLELWQDSGEMEAWRMNLGQLRSAVGT